MQPDSSRMMRRVLMSGVASLAIAGVARAEETAEAAAKRAVSDVNARIEGAFGALDSNGFGHLAGAVTVPLGERFGLQFDGLVRYQNDDATVGGAAHLFWRDPETGLVGLYASHMRFNAADASVSRFGVEGEAYLGNFSFIGVGGWQQSDVAGVIEENPFADLDFAFYPTDDLRLTAGYRYDGVDSFGVVGAEYKFANNASGKIEGQFGEDGQYSVWAGLSIYIGGDAPDKSLKRRHREDDPTIWMTRQKAPRSTGGGGGGGGPTGSCTASGYNYPGAPLIFQFCPADVPPPAGWTCEPMPVWAEPTCFSPAPNPGDLMCTTGMAPG